MPNMPKTTPPMPKMTYNVQAAADEGFGHFEILLGGWFTLFSARWPWQTIYALGTHLAERALDHGAKPEHLGAKRFGRLEVLDGGRGAVVPRG